MGNIRPVVLTEIQKKIALKQIERLAGHRPQCTACGSRLVIVPDELFRLDYDGQIGVGHPVVTLWCDQCYHISLFSAVGLGVIGA